MSLNEAKNVGNTVVLARLFNEVQAQKMPSRMVRLILSEYLQVPKASATVGFTVSFVCIDMYLTSHLLPPHSNLRRCLIIFLFPWLSLSLTGQASVNEGTEPSQQAICELHETITQSFETEDYTRVIAIGLRLRDAALASGEEEYQDILFDTYDLLIYSYHHRNLIDSALLIFREATDYGESHSPNMLLSDIYLRGSYILEGSESKRLMGLAMKNAVLFKDSIMLANLHYAYSMLFMEDDGPEDSIRFHLQSATILFRLLNDRSGLIWVKRLRADWNAQRGLGELALANYNNIYSICKRISFNNNYCNDSEYNIGEQFYLLGLLDSARWYTEQCLVRAEYRSDYGVAAQCHDLLAKVNEQRRDFERAFYHQGEYHSFNEKVHNAATRSAIALEKVRQNNGAAVEAREKAEFEAQLLAAANRQYRTIGFCLLGILLLGGGLLWKLNQARSSLARSNAELDITNQTKDKFFGLIAHDLRGPVMALGSVGDQLKLLLSQNKFAEALETANHVEQSSKRLSRLLDNLLKWALVKKGMIPYQPESLDLATAGEENIALFLDSAKLKRVILTSEIGAGQLIYADPRAVSTVLRNLINNALKFTPSGGTICLSARVVDAGIELSVNDNGIGIQPDKIEALFKLASSSSFGTAGEKGTGLGLVLCQELVKLNGGSIRAESVDGRGCSFFVTWPIKPQS
ncbi:MAG: signal transduction histidine kinase [Neolewinella sp.]